jgi:hypothetical protein
VNQTTSHSKPDLAYRLVNAVAITKVEETGDKINDLRRWMVKAQESVRAILKEEGIEC